MSLFNKLNGLQLLIASFALVILFGSILLSLPISSASATFTPFLNALFTATSATCVTGLVVYDTATHFNIFGQIIILLLIQVGGLGFITILFGVMSTVGKKLNLKQKSYIVDNFGSFKLKDSKVFIKRILFITVAIELAGTIILSFQFVPIFGTEQGLWFSLFYAVSAFCNAGFDLSGYYNSGSSLISFNNNPLIILTISFLIIVGGIGFIVLNDCFEHKFEFKKFSFHSKLVIYSTTFLLIVSFIAFFFFEMRSSFMFMSLKERVLNSWFAAVTPRTAGFNSVVIGRMSEAGLLLTILLMFIGAAPGSTGGGFKITSTVVILKALYSYITKKRSVNLLGFKIDNADLLKTFVTIAMFLLLLALCSLLLCAHGVPVVNAVYECTSALSTVGLSTGITSSLTWDSKLALILLMFIGRVGSLSIFLAASKPSEAEKIQNPTAKLMIG